MKNTMVENTDSLDFTPLQRHFRLRDIYKVVEQSTATRSILIALSIICSLTLVLLLIAAVISSEILGFFTSSLLTIGFFLLLSYTLTKSALYSFKLKEFAKLNDLTYVSARTKDRKGLLFSSGHSHSIIDGLRLHDESSPDLLEIANYTYSIGYGKSEVFHPYAYVRMRLPRHIPNMVLDASSNNFLRSFTNLPASIKDAQRLSLEGDFNEHFNLYVPKDYERDALYIFTPNLMLALLEYSADLDIEIIGDELYFFKKGTFRLTSPKELKRLITLSNRIHAIIFRNAENYWDFRTKKRASNRIAKNGRTLRKNFVFRSSLWAIIIGLVVITLALIGYVSLTYVPN